MNHYKSTHRKSMASWLLLSFFFFGTTTATLAQDETVAVETEPSEEAVSPLKLGVGVEVGTHALGGISFVALFKEKIGVRIGYNNMNYSRDNIELTYDNVDLLGSASIDRSHLFLATDIALFGKGAVRFVAGAGIMTGNSLNIVSTIPGERQINDILVTSEQVGNITLDISTKSKTNYYVGLGFGRVVPKKRIGFNFDIGGFYLNEFDVKMSASNLLRHNILNQESIENDINSVSPWWPVATFRINIKLM